MPLMPQQPQQPSNLGRGRVERVSAAGSSVPPPPTPSAPPSPPTPPSPSSPPPGRPTVNARTGQRVSYRNLGNMMREGLPQGINVVDFIKRTTGGRRRMFARFPVPNYTRKPGQPPRSWDPKRYNLAQAYDEAKRKWRMVNLDSVIRVTTPDGQEYRRWGGVGGDKNRTGIPESERQYTQSPTPRQYYPQRMGPDVPADQRAPIMSKMQGERGARRFRDWLRRSREAGGPVPFSEPGPSESVQFKAWAPRPDYLGRPPQHRVLRYSSGVPLHSQRVRQVLRRGPRNPELERRGYLPRGDPRDDQRFGIESHRMLQRHRDWQKQLNQAGPIEAGPQAPSGSGPGRTPTMLEASRRPETKTGLPRGEGMTDEEMAAEAISQTDYNSPMYAPSNSKLALHRMELRSPSKSVSDGDILAYGKTPLSESREIAAKRIASEQRLSAISDPVARLRALMRANNRFIVPRDIDARVDVLRGNQIYPSSLDELNSTRRLLRSEHPLYGTGIPFEDPEQEFGIERPIPWAQRKRPVGKTGLPVGEGMTNEEMAAEASAKTIGAQDKIRLADDPEAGGGPQDLKGYLSSMELRKRSPGVSDKELARSLAGLDRLEKPREAAANRLREQMQGILGVKNPEFGDVAGPYGNIERRVIPRGPMGLESNESHVDPYDKGTLNALLRDVPTDIKRRIISRHLVDMSEGAPRPEPIVGKRRVKYLRMSHPLYGTGIPFEDPEQEFAAVPGSGIAKIGLKKFRHAEPTGMRRMPSYSDAQMKTQRQHMTRQMDYGRGVPLEMAMLPTGHADQEFAATDETERLTGRLRPPRHAYPAYDLGVSQGSPGTREPSTLSGVPPAHPEHHTRLAATVRERIKTLGGPGIQDAAPTLHRGPGNIRDRGALARHLRSLRGVYNPLKEQHAQLPGGQFLPIQQAVDPIEDMQKRISTRSMSIRPWKQFTRVRPGPIGRTFADPEQAFMRNDEWDQAMGQSRRREERPAPLAGTETNVDSGMALAMGRGSQTGTRPWHSDIGSQMDPTATPRDYKAGPRGLPHAGTPSRSLSHPAIQQSRTTVRGLGRQREKRAIAPTRPRWMLPDTGMGPDLRPQTQLDTLGRAMGVRRGSVDRLGQFLRNPNMMTDPEYQKGLSMLRKTLGGKGRLNPYGRSAGDVLPGVWQRLSRLERSGVQVDPRRVLRGELRRRVPLRDPSLIGAAPLPKRRPRTPSRTAFPLARRRVG